MSLPLFLLLYYCNCDTGTCFYGCPAFQEALLSLLSLRNSGRHDLCSVQPLVFSAFIATHDQEEQVFKLFLSLGKK